MKLTPQELEEIKDALMKNKGIIVWHIVKDVLCWLTVIACLATVCWLGIHGMKGLLWFPITVGIITCLN
jgi:hypothetical protein